MNDKIKYIFPTLLVCVLCLISCSSDSGSLASDAGPLAELKFDLQGISRANVTNNTNFNSKSFMVFGDRKFMDSPSSESTVIFQGDEVKYNSSENVWEYSNPQYWLPKHEHSFVAIHPANAMGISNTAYSDNTLSFSYTLPDNFTDAPDILASTHRRMYVERGTSLNASVKFKFIHIMSAVNFSLKCNGAADKVTITKVELEGVNKTGTFTITPAPLSPDIEQTDDYTLFWSDSSNKDILTAGINVDVNNGETKSLLPDGNALFMVPQPDNKGIIMRMTYIYDNGTEPTEQTLTAQAPIGGWETGKMYSYILALDIVEEKSCITIGVEVTDWEEGTSTDIIVPRK